MTEKKHPGMAFSSGTEGRPGAVRKEVDLKNKHNIKKSTPFSAKEARKVDPALFLSCEKARAQGG